MYRWLLVVLAGYIIYRMFKNDIKAKVEERKRDDARRGESGEMIRDPICGTFVEAGDAVTVRDGDNIYYFCGYDCRDAFLKRLQNGESPESIIAGAKLTQPDEKKAPQADGKPDAAPGDDAQDKEK